MLPLYYYRKIGIGRSDYFLDWKYESAKNLHSVHLCLKWIEGHLMTRTAKIEQRPESACLIRGHLKESGLCAVRQTKA